MRHRQLLVSINMCAFSTFQATEPHTVCATGVRVGGQRENIVYITCIIPGESKEVG